MNIGIITPAPPGSSSGNRITARRWAEILKKLGHTVSVSQSYEDQQFDLFIALHARRSHSSIARFHRRHPNKPIVVALTGTDLYRDIQISRRARNSLKLARRIVVLQPLALRQLTRAERRKARVIYQSVVTLRGSRRSKPGRTPGQFDICVIGHLRPVKDPFRAALAARMLPESSRIRVIHAGRAMSKQMDRQALTEMRINRRYHWSGELSRRRTLKLLARSKVCVISSRMEGGANILSEALVAGVPVLASRIDGNIGILGKDYPGFFRVADNGELAQLMLRAETDPKFVSELHKRVEKLAPLFAPRHEQQAWASLVNELCRNGA